MTQPKTMLVTGGGIGIGRATALAFARAGHHVVVTDILDAEGRATRMVMQVHDELVLEVPQAELAWAREALPRLMAGAATLKVPLLAEVGVGANWEQAH